MSQDKIPRDKNGRPLEKNTFIVEVELNGVGPPKFVQATIEVAGVEKSTVKDLKGEYYVVDNSKVRIIE